MKDENDALNGRMPRSARLAAAVLASLSIAALLAGCPKLFGDRDNPVDPDSGKYQGYPVVESLAALTAVSPGDGAAYTSSASSIDFVVAAVAGADRYAIQVSSSSDFSQAAGILADLTQATTLSNPNKFTVSVSSLKVGTMYWRARASKGGTWSPAWTAAQRVTLSSVSTSVSSIAVAGAGGATAITADKGTLQMVAAVSPTNASIKSVDWSIASGAAFATISPSGLLSAVKDGTVIVTAAARDGSGRTGSATITVSGQIVLVTGIAVSGAGGVSTIAVDKATLALTATPSPPDATNKSVTWAIASGANCATINSSGAMTAIVTPIRDGSITIVAAAADGSGITSSPFAVTITGQIVLVTSISVNGQGGAGTVLVNDDLQMVAAVLPSDAANKTVAWSVANGTGQATIGASNGLLHAVANGAVTVTATAQDGTNVTGTKVVTVGIPVTGITVAGTGGAAAIATDDGTLQMIATVAPADATDKSVTWSVTDGSGHATISAGGLLTAVTNGSVTVTATSNANQAISGSAAITLSNQIVVAPTAPSTPDLAAADDTGSSSADNVTRNTTGLTLSGTAQAGVTVTIKDGSTTVGTTVADGGGAYSLDVSLAAGTHSLAAIATRSGLDSSPSAALTLVVDASASAPSAPDLAAEDDTGISNADNNTMIDTGLTFSGSGAEAGATISLVSNLDGVVGTTTAAGDGAWSLDVALSVSLVTSHSITARQTDLAGNVSADSTALSVQIDQIGALVSWSVALITPFQGRNTGLSKRPTFTWTQASAGAGYRLVVDDDSAFGSPEIDRYFSGLSATSYTPTSDLPVSSAQPVGRRYYVSVRAVDAAGNPYVNSNNVSAQRYVNVGRFDNDFNGDGYSDLALGAYGFDNGALADAGKIYINYGGPSMALAAGPRMVGTAAGQQLGRDLSGAGDLNGDGFCDLVVNGGLVYFGGASMDAVADLQLVPPSGSIDKVARAGDLNGDGYGDVAVSHNNNVSVFFGGASMDAAADLTISSGTFNFGGALSSAGDLNKDGYDDLLVGNSDYDSPATDAGSVGIYYGGSAMDSTADVTLTGTAYAQYFGHGLAGAGDMNGDGFPDVAVGIPYAAAQFDGKAYVYFGPAFGYSFDATADATLNHTQAGEEMGDFVSSGGDINGDGYDDILVGSPRYGSNAGRATIFFGATAPAAFAQMDGTWAGGNFGFRVMMVGDCNADGYADFAVSAPYADSNGADSGSVFFYFGSSTGSYNYIEFKGENSGDNLGYWPGYAVGA